MTLRLGIKAYARHRKDLGLSGGTPAAVRKALERGQIRKDGAGLIVVQEADRAWPSDPDRIKGASRGTGDTKTESGGSAPTEGTKPETGELARARVRKETALARRREIEVSKMEGALVDRSRVSSAWFEVQRLTRDRLLLIPDRLAEQLAAEPSPDQVRAIIDSEIRSALEAAVFDLEKLASESE